MAPRLPDYVSFDSASRGKQRVTPNDAIFLLAKSLAVDLKLSLGDAQERAGAELYRLQQLRELHLGEDSAFDVRELARAVNQIERPLIAEAVQKGVMTPDQAEERARQRRLDPFATEPTLGEFDPLKSPRATDWTLLMTVAWVASQGRVEVVQYCWNEFRARSYEWIKFKNNEPGWYIAPRVKSSFADLSDYNVSGAQDQLRQSLRLGELVASALDGAGRPTIIPAVDWPHLVMSEEANDAVLRTPATRHPFPPAFRDVRLPRAEIIKVFNFSTVTKSKAGTKRMPIWDHVEVMLRKEFDKRGDYNEIDQAEDWDSQTDVETHVIAWIQRKHPASKLPGKNSLYANVKRIVEQIRASKSR